MGPISRSQSYSSVASSPASPPAVPRPPPRPSLNRQSTASNTSMASTTSTNSNTSTRPTVAFVHGPPKEFQIPKSFSTIAKNMPKLYSTISTVTFFKGGVAKVTSFDRELAKNLSKLSHQVGKPLTIESKASSTTPPPQQTTRPSFSCVVVEHDISETEIAEYLSSKKSLSVAFYASPQPAPTVQRCSSASSLTIPTPYKSFFLKGLPFTPTFIVWRLPTTGRSTPPNALSATVSNTILPPALQTPPCVAAAAAHTPLPITNLRYPRSAATAESVMSRSPWLAPSAQKLPPQLKPQLNSNTPTSL